MELPVVINFKVELRNPRLIQYLIPEGFTYICIEQRGKSALIESRYDRRLSSGFNPCRSIPLFNHIQSTTHQPRRSLLSVCLSGCRRIGIHLFTLYK